MRATKAIIFSMVSLLLAGCDFSSFIIDKVSKKNYMLGKRSVEVAMFRSPGQIAFIERTVSGNVMTTSITDDLSSVHSRNSVVYGQIVPSQYYGKCVIR